ncbi:MAG: putative holin-like toxin [Oscillospiraceae bacterium]|nr:putative holin-like toxin [Oscillospiraceae bacterium]
MSVYEALMVALALAMLITAILKDKRK